MNENDLFNFQLEYTFTADWLAELDRQLASCCPHGGHHAVGSGFRPEHGFVDMPPEPQRAFTRRRSPKRCPNSYRRCRVREVSWTGGNTGKLFPKVVITSA